MRRCRSSSAASASTRSRPTVGREVHAALLRAGGRRYDPPGRSAGASAWARCAAALDDHDQPSHQRPHRRRRRRPMTARDGPSRRPDRRRDGGDRPRRLRPRRLPRGPRRATASRSSTRRSSTTSARSRCRASSSAACRTGCGSSTGRTATRRSPDERIDAPIVVIGMFRAGTTFLSYLLDQDRAQPRAAPRGRPGDSVPPPTPADHRGRSARRRGARQRRHARAAQPADRAVVHHEEADGPTECIAVMSQDFKSLSWEAIANVPAYGEWLLGRRPALGVRVPPAGAAGAPERRRPWPLDAQEPAPRDRARRADRGLPRRPARAAAPRSGRARAHRCAA